MLLWKETQAGCGMILMAVLFTIPVGFIVILVLSAMFPAQINPLIHGAMGQEMGSAVVAGGITIAIGAGISYLLGGDVRSLMEKVLKFLVYSFFSGWIIYFLAVLSGLIKANTPDPYGFGSMRIAYILGVIFVSIIYVCLRTQ
jgi:hypothetical protein